MVGRADSSVKKSELLMLTSNWQKPWYIYFSTVFDMLWFSGLINASWPSLLCFWASHTKMHKHLPGLCKAVVIDSLVINSSVETHFKASLLCTLLPVMAVQAITQVFHCKRKNICCYSCRQTSGWCSVVLSVCCHSGITTLVGLSEMYGIYMALYFKINCRTGI